MITTCIGRLFKSALSDMAVLMSDVSSTTMVFSEFHGVKLRRFFAGFLALRSIAGLP